MDFGAIGVNGNENKGCVDRKRAPRRKKGKALKWEDRNEDRDRRMQRD